METEPRAWDLTRMSGCVANGSVFSNVYMSPNLKFFDSTVFLSSQSVSFCIFIAIFSPTWRAFISIEMTLSRMWPIF